MGIMGPLFLNGSARAQGGRHRGSDVGPLFLNLCSGPKRWNLQALMPPTEGVQGAVLHSQDGDRT